MKNDPIESPPYDLLRDLFEHAQVIPFLGAGASFPDQVEESDSFTGLPTGNELAYHLAERMGLPKGEVHIDNLIEVASCFELYTGRYFLEEMLEHIFNPDQRPSSLHYFLAQVPVLPLIITTNYNTLIERAFREAGREFHTIMTPIYDRSYSRHHVLWWAPGAEKPLVQTARGFKPTPEDLPVVYKVHGGFDPTGQWQRSVITEDDYFEIGGRIYESSLLPYYVGAALQRNPLLFLGHSLRDTHVRYMISQFRRQFKDRKDSLVTKSVSELDRWRFKPLGLSIYELTLAAFVDGLQRDNAKPDAL